MHDVFSITCASAHLTMLSKVCFVSLLVTLPLSEAVTENVIERPLHPGVGSRGSLMRKNIDATPDQDVEKHGEDVHGISLLNQQDASDAVHGTVEPPPVQQVSILDDPALESVWARGRFSIQSVAEPNACLEVEPNCGNVTCDDFNCTSHSTLTNSSGTCRLKFAQCSGGLLQAFHFIDEDGAEVVGKVPRLLEESKRFAPVMYDKRCLLILNADQPAHPCNQEMYTGYEGANFYFSYDPTMAFRVHSNSGWCLNYKNMNTWYGGVEVFDPCGDYLDSMKWITRALTYDD